MPVSVTMPRLGESVTEGTVTRWLKKEGERVEVDEPLLEVSTDKVDTEIPSPAAGDGISVSTLSVETSSSGSSASTRSPSCFNHRVIVPSVTLSPSCGMVTDTGISQTPCM